MLLHIRRARGALRFARVVAAVSVVALVSLLVAASIVAVAFWDGRGSAIALGLAVLLVPRGVRRGRRPPRAGVELSRGAEPELWRLVERSAHVVSGCEPDAVLVTAGTTVAYAVSGDREVLEIGLPWIAAGPGELEAAIVAAAARRAAGACSSGERRLVDRLRVARERTYVRRPWRAAYAADLRLAEWGWGRYLRAREVAVSAALDAAAGTVRAPGLDQAAARNDTYAVYWSEDVAPCIEDGFVPSIVAGWRQWAGVTDTDGGVLKTSEASIERRLLTVVVPDAASELVDIAWDGVAEAVWLPRMRAAVASAHEHLPPFEPGAMEMTLTLGAPAGVPAHEWAGLVGAALTVALVDRKGWTAETGPGQPVNVVDGRFSIEPLGLCRAAVDGDWDPGPWESFVREAGIDGLVVGAPAALPERTVWPTTVPAYEPPQEFVLRGTQRRRRQLAQLVAATGGLLLVLVALAFAGFQATAKGGTAITESFVVVFALGSGWWMRSKFAAVLAAGRVVVAPGGVDIRHAAALKSTLHVPRDAVECVVIDDGTWSEDRRFPVGSPAVGDPRWWLWARGRAPLVPVVGADDATPNLALVFSRPVPAPASSVRSLAAPLRDEAMAAVLLEVEDPVAARAAFRSWGVTRALRDDDADRILHRYWQTDASAPATSRARADLVLDREIRDATLALVGGLIVPPIALVAAVIGWKLRKRRSLLGPLIAFGGLAVFAVRVGFYLA